MNKSFLSAGVIGLLFLLQSAVAIAETAEPTQTPPPGCPHTDTGPISDGMVWLGGGLPLQNGTVLYPAGSQPYPWPNDPDFKPIISQNTRDFDVEGGCCVQDLNLRFEWEIEEAFPPPYAYMGPADGYPPGVTNYEHFLPEYGINNAMPMSVLPGVAIMRMSVWNYPPAAYEGVTCPENEGKGQTLECWIKFIQIIAPPAQILDYHGNDTITFQVEPDDTWASQDYIWWLGFKYQFSWGSHYIMKNDPFLTVGEIRAADPGFTSAPIKMEAAGDKHPIIGHTHWIIASDSVNVVLMKLDLDADSDNNQGYAAPARDNAEDEIEDDEGRPGKYIFLNDGDSDFDTVPDFADGFNWDGVIPSADDALTGMLFVPIVLELPAPIDLDLARVELIYDASHPGQLSCGPNPPADCEPAPGLLRIWRKDAPQQRAISDFVEPTVYEARDLVGQNRIVTLYAEGVNPGAGRIVVRVDPDGNGPEGWVTEDAVRCSITQHQVVVEWEALNTGNIKTTLAASVPDGAPVSEGLAIYPDKDTPDEANVKDVIGLRAIVLKPPVSNHDVYFRVFDMDDPSDDGPIDPNGPAGGDNNLSSPGQGDPGEWHDDPNNNIGTEIGVSDNERTTIFKPHAKTDAAGISRAQFKVSKRPGDNYRAAVSTNLNNLDSIIIDGTGLSGGNQNNTSFSTLLTVFRRLWVEIDSMSEVPLSINRFPEGFPTSIASYVNNATFSSLEIAHGLSSGWNEHNHFEYGTIQFPSMPGFPMQENLTIISNNLYNGFTVQESVGPNIIDRMCIVYDDDFDGNTNQYKENLPETYNPGGSQLFKDRYIRAFIESDVFPASYNVLPFMLNTFIADSLCCNRNLPNISEGILQEFWGAYLIMGYQGTTIEDRDPDGPSYSVSGRAYRGERWGVLFLETLRDKSSLANYQSYRLNHIDLLAAHEIGHQFGLLDDEDSEDFHLMDSYDIGNCLPQQTKPEFRASDIKALRTTYPGNYE